MQYLRQSTAGQEVLLGPFLDDTDGKTAETGLTIANTDIKIWKTGATSEANKNSGGATHITAGRYYAVLDATDTNTIGPAEINVVMAGALPVKHRFTVLAANVFDWLFGTTAPNTTTPLDAAGIRTAVGLGSANLDTQLGDIPTVSEFNARTLATADYATAAALATVDSNVDAILVDTGTDIPATLSTIAGYIDTEIGAIQTALTTVDGIVDSILEDTAAIPAFPTNFSILDIDASGFVTDADSGGGSSLTQADVRAAIGLTSANLDTQLAAIAGYVDTEIGSLQTAVATIDANVDAILEDTGTTIPANIAALNDLDAADIRTAVGLASANLDTQLADIPTVAEVNARTLVAADYATATALATVDTVVDGISTEVNKIPRSGQTYRHTNQDTAATADVTIGAAV